MEEASAVVECTLTSMRLQPIIWVGIGTMMARFRLAGVFWAARASERERLVCFVPLCEFWVYFVCLVLAERMVLVFVVGLCFYCGGMVVFFSDCSQMTA